MNGITLQVCKGEFQVIVFVMVTSVISIFVRTTSLPITLAFVRAALEYVFLFVKDNLYSTSTTVRTTSNTYVYAFEIHIICQAHFETTSCLCL